MAGGADTDDGVAPTVHLEEIEAHLEKHLGEIAIVLHEIVSEKIHLDLLVIDPGKAADHWIFVSSGMSDRPMAVPKDIENADDLKFAELTITLPKSWLGPDPWKRGAAGAFDGEAQWYPLRLLKDLARYPHDNKTWVGMGHSLVNKGQDKPIGPGTQMTGSLLMPPLHWPRGSSLLKTTTGETINFLAILPLYPSEMQFKLEHGTDQLLDRFDAAGITEVFDPKRKNVCTTSFWSRLRGN